MMYHKDLGIIILAAGKGTRMNSDIPKVLHLINGRTMISYVLKCAASLAEEKNIVVVVGHQAEKVKKEISNGFNILYALQEELTGTGDAVRSGVQFLPHTVKNVLILCGDVPLIKAETLLKLVNNHENCLNDVTVLTTILSDPSGYGRIVLDINEKILCIKEDADADAEEKQISIVNSGIYCVRLDFLVQGLDLIRRNNLQREYYLTDIIGIARAKGYKAGYVVADDPTELKGVNTVQELNNLEKLIPGLDL